MGFAREGGATNAVADVTVCGVRAGGRPTETMSTYCSGNRIK